MTSAVNPSSADHTQVSHLLRCGARLGVLESVLVTMFAVVSRKLSGSVETGLEAAVLIAGLAATIVLPGQWTRARTIEGIAGAAGVGLTAAGVFLVIDVALLQPIGLYTNRWLEIGGGANWWYHPVWWMLGTFLAWMGAWVQANQAGRSGAASPVTLVVAAVLTGALLMVLATLVHFPGAGWGIGTFAVSVIPALPILVLVTGIGTRRP